MKISKKATTIAVINQKGGTGKTTTCENLGVGLAMEGKKVLLVDADPQGSLTVSMGWQDPDALPTTLSTLMQKAMNDQCIPPGEGILHHAEGVDLIPANIELAGLEVALVNTMSREKVMKQVLESAKREYDYILIDCTPSLDILVKLRLVAATRKILQNSNLPSVRNIRKLPGKTAKRNVLLCVKLLKLIHRRQQSMKPSCRKAVNDAASMPKIKSWLNRSLLIQSPFNLNRLLKRLKK